MNNLDRQYKELLQQIIHFGVEKQDRTGTGTKSIFGWQIRHNMKEGFPLLTTKKMAFKTMVTELLWFLRGDTNIKFLVDNNCHIWDGDAYKNFKSRFSQMKGVQSSLPTKDEFIDKIKNLDGYAELWGELGPIYGKQWRSWHWRSEPVLPGEKDMIYTTEGKPVTWSEEKYIDQIENLINELKTNPDSRRMLVSAWNVGELDQMVLPPCHYGFQIYTRELSFKERFNLYNQNERMHFEECTMDLLDKYNVPTRAISLMWNQRSVDTFLGLPFNIASYGLLLEILAKTVNMVPEELIGNLGDVHLYNNHIEQAAEQCSRHPYKLPKLNINTEFWPTESGSCGEGPLDAIAVFNSFQNDNFCKCLLEDDIQLENYQSHPAIKAPLSN